MQQAIAEERPIPKPMKRIVLYVPTTLNNGGAAAEEDLHTIEDLVMDAFGGCTLHPHLLGGWVNDEEERCRDSMLKVEIEADDRPDLLITITAMGGFIRKRLEQDLVFITVEDVGVLLV
jgi:hypothetical protein